MPGPGSGSGWIGEQGRDVMIKTDKKRASYYNYYSSKRWGDSKSNPEKNHHRNHISHHAENAEHRMTDSIPHRAYHPKIT